VSVIAINLDIFFVLSYSLCSLSSDSLWDGDNDGINSSIFLKNEESSLAYENLPTLFCFLGNWGVPYSDATD